MNNQPNGPAPSGRRYAVGAKGGLVAQAWQRIWDLLDAERYQDGMALAEKVARELGWTPFPPGVIPHPRVGIVQPQSIMTHMHRMATEGLVETKKLPVSTTVFRHGKEHSAKRQRAHFRIPQSNRRAA